MNTTKTSYPKYNSKPFFGYTVKHNWQQLAFYLILVFLTMILPCILRLDDLGVTSFVDDAYENILRDIGYIGFFVSAFMGVFSGMVALSYVNSKQNINLRHSLPLKRSAIFLTEALSGAIYYVASAAVGFLIPLFVTKAAAGNNPLDIPGYFMIILMSVLAFLYTYSVTLFAAGLTGTAIVRLLLAGVIMLLPAVLYLMIVYSVDMAFSSLRLFDSYYCNGRIIGILAPGYRLILTVLEGRDYDTWQTVLIVIKSVVAIAVGFTGAFFLHKYRKTEATGTTIIWKPVFAATKYILIFSAGLLGYTVFGSGELFGGGKSTADGLFGVTIGLVLAFIVINCIMYRSARAMFKGLKPFAVIAVLTILFVFVVPLNMFGIFDKLYSVTNTREITVSSGNISITFDGSEECMSLDELVGSLEECTSTHESAGVDVVDGIYSDTDQEYLAEKFPEYILPAMTDEELLKLAEEYGLKYVYHADGTVEIIEDIDVLQYYYSDFGINYVGGVASSYNGNRSLTVIQYPKFGIPLAIHVTVPTDGEVWEAIRESDEFKEAHDLTKIEADKIKTIELRLGYDYSEISLIKDMISYCDYTNYYKNDSVEKILSPSDSALVRELAAGLCEICDYNLGEKADSPMIGMVDVYYIGESGYQEVSEFPIFAGDIELVSEVERIFALIRMEEPQNFTSADEVYDDYLSLYTDAIMINTETGNARKIDIEEVADISGFFTAITSDRMDVYYHLDYTDTENVGYVVVVKNTASEYECTGTLYFREGAVDKAELDVIFDSLK